MPPELALLPIDEHVASVIAAVKSHGCAVVQAPPGSGKTTRLPSALLDAGLSGDGSVVLLQPRRAAARAAARRIAFERGERVGETIGYQVRFDECVGPKTRLRCVTDGVLLRMLQDDPFLAGVGCVVFDEFHERSLNMDLTMAMIRRVRDTVRSDLKVVVMSATLAAEPIAAWWNNAPIISARGRTFPVAMDYADDLAAANQRPDIAAAVERVLPRSAGDILVFLPGLREIRSAADELQLLARRHALDVQQMYADLPPEQQDAVLRPSERRRVILSTNVAETSLTIPGVTAVIDTGTARQPRFDSAVGLDRLELRRISRASADQRAGRAGRVAAGYCLRLWSQREHSLRDEFDEPEIRHCDLSGAILQLLSWGESDVAAFPWFEPPPAGSVDRAMRLLEDVGAVDAGRLTATGRRMAALPLSPRLARMMIAGVDLGVIEECSLAAGLLNDRDPFQRPASSPGSRGGRAAVHVSPSDLLDRVHAIQQFESTGTTDFSFGTVHRGGVRGVLQARTQLKRLCRSLEPAEWGCREIGSRDERVLRAIAAAYLDRLVARREPSGRRGLMSGGRGVRLADSSAVSETKLFVAIDLDAGESESVVRLASEVQRAWLPVEQLQAEEEIIFDPAKERVQAMRVVRFRDLPLDRGPVEIADLSRAAVVLAEAALADWDRFSPRMPDTATEYLLRCECLSHWLPDCNLPAFDAETMQAITQEAASGRRSFDELALAPWLDLITQRLTWAQQQLVEREAPAKWTAPSGSRITIQYQRGQSPVIAVRIQELFGLAETPRIAAARVPLVLHLLAPNGRPQQITADLKSFWNTTYSQVRKDLKARYPKHAWPEDPWTAPPQSRPQRRRLE